ncbi:MAG TPA: type II toxin-antitoxin system PemK/MazF family toxin [Promineifilum sp.]|nr:type II toxin-antitoxin system PemK/MazF family toxin [Promineifilum sp.]
MATKPNRGEVWLADLDPTRGHEQAGKRPVLIVSTNQYNYGSADLVLVLPLTRRNRGIPIHIPIRAPEGGVSAPSYILCDGLRSISKERLIASPWGNVSPQTMNRVNRVLRILMEL